VSQIDNIQRLNLEGPYLLAELAEDAEGPLAGTFDALAYNVVVDYAMTRCGGLRRRARGQTGQNLPVYDVPDDLLEDIAHETAWRTCESVRNNAGKFDPDLGGAANWVLGRAALVYLGLARKLHAQRARFGELNDPHDLTGILDRDDYPDDESAQRALDAEALQEAAACLSQREAAVFFGIVLFDLAKRDIAMQLYGAPDKEKAVDGVLQRAKKKLAAAWAERRPLTPTQPSSSNVPTENADEEAV
jgi:DNA-directed RNA polymerase specialized sigma24 family protein